MSFFVLPALFPCFLLVYRPSLLHFRVLSLWLRRAACDVLDKIGLPVHVECFRFVFVSQLKQLH